jgi:ArsR family transcriptional regulator
MRTELVFRALADGSRLRILRLLGEMELAVGELAQVLEQSQPRVSRHVAILCDAELAERRREGSWVFVRGRCNGLDVDPLGGAIARALATAERSDADFARQCGRDRGRLAAVRDARESQASDYFQRHAAEWDELRRLHSPDRMVEKALVGALAGQPIGRLLDIGTGTGRMAELFAPMADHIVALDKNLEMLRLARAKLQHLPADRVELVQGDFAALPQEAGSFDTVLLHQVLHFAQEPQRALLEAARVTKPGGRVAVVDFAAHAREELRERHAHARLGFEDEAMAGLLERAQLAPEPALALSGGPLVVKIWVGRREGAAPVARVPGIAGGRP